MAWFTDNWPWWVAFAWLVSYEIYALIARKKTLSQMVWASTKSYPWVVPIAFSFLWALGAHFWVAGANGWALAILGVVVTWIAYTQVKGEPAMLTREPVVLLGLGNAALMNILIQIAKAYGIELTPEMIGGVWALVTLIVSLIQRQKVTPVAAPRGV